jgi:hypothetical protein
MRLPHRHADRSDAELVDGHHAPRLSHPGVVAARLIIGGCL